MTNGVITKTRTLCRETIGRIADRFDWDRSGIALAILLVAGEGTAVGLAATSLASEGWNLGDVAAFTGAAVLLIYVPAAIIARKLPFATLTEFERRRKYAQKVLDVKIPRPGQKMKDGTLLLGNQVFLTEDSEESIKAAVGWGYCLGDQYLDHLLSSRWGEMQWKPEVYKTIHIAAGNLRPPVDKDTSISVGHGLLVPIADEEQGEST